jgi:hypothetical protein
VRSQIISAFLLLAVAGEIGLLVSGYRVLMKETLVRPGEYYLVEGYDNLGDANQASLACRYFTGRAFMTIVFWYSESNVLGRDSCPFLYRP